MIVVSNVTGPSTIGPFLWEGGQTQMTVQMNGTGSIKFQLLDEIGGTDTMLSVSGPGFLQGSMPPGNYQVVVPSTAYNVSVSLLHILN